MKIGHNQKCFQCQEFKSETLSLNEGTEEQNICESCINLYMDGEIKFVDAHDTAD